MKLPTAFTEKEVARFYMMNILTYDFAFNLCLWMVGDFIFEDKSTYNTCWKGNNILHDKYPYYNKPLINILKVNEGLYK